MKSYTPYENVARPAYPAILAITSLNDTRVLYVEPAKWVARLRATAAGGADPAQDRDGGRPRRPQRPLRRLAGGGVRAGLDHRTANAGLAARWLAAGVRVRARWRLVQDLDGVAGAEESAWARVCRGEVDAEPDLALPAAVAGPGGG